MEAGLCRNPMEVDKLVEQLGEPRWRGAEAYLYTTSWLGKPAIVKVRLPKKYRHSLLDLRLRWSRTVTEARALHAAATIGVPVPKLYYVDPICTLIVTEYIEGRLLAEIVEKSPRDAERYAERVGEYAGLLHEAGISHGDLTTSNVLVSGDGRVYFIDFGLASLHASDRDQAIDIHLYLRSLESTHPEHVDMMLESFLRGYRRVRGGEATDKLLQLVKEIRLMGRYVAERKTAWGG